MTKKVPLLGSIFPFLFSRESSSDEKVKIVVFLTPEIIELEYYSKSSSNLKKELLHQD